MEKIKIKQEKIKIKEISEYLNCTVQSLYYMKKNNYNRFELIVLGYQKLKEKNC